MLDNGFLICNVMSDAGSEGLPAEGEGEGAADGNHQQPRVRRPSRPRLEQVEP